MLHKSLNISAVNISKEQSVALHKMCMICCYNGLN